MLALPLRHYRRVTLHLAVALPAAGDPAALDYPTALEDPTAEEAAPGPARTYCLRVRRDGWLDFDPG